ncbi:MAG: hypothetical protein U0414_22375 [Polyangiaceae bacterium]
MSRAHAVAALLALTLSGCSSRAEAGRPIPAKVTAFDEKDVVLDVRASSLEKGALRFDAVVGNNEERTLVGLHVEVALLDASGATIKKVDLTPLGARAKLTVLEPNYEVAIHELIQTDTAPASVVARVSKAETYTEPADPPAKLDVTGDAQGLEFMSLGHFRFFGAPEDRAELPFRASIGIRNTGTKTVKRVEYGLRFLDENGKESDRVPRSQVFEPPLLPGDAIVDPIQTQVRAYDQLQIDVRTVVFE